MNRIYNYINIILGLMLFASCSTEDTPDSSDDLALYYVKYEVTFKTKHVNTEKIIRFKTENGKERISFTEWKSSIYWDGTYGPVDKNFRPFISCVVPDYKYASEIHARIYISREKEPFVIKAEGDGEYSLSLETKIDF